MEGVLCVVCLCVMWYWLDRTDGTPVHAFVLCVCVWCVCVVCVCVVCVWCVCGVCVCV